MKVSLIDYTGAGSKNCEDYAAAVLIFTKSTRLNMSPGLFEEIINWPTEKKMEELAYIANTIPSSWEFIDYTFMIEGVTRAFTHQLVRTRNASYAQQTMRILNVEGWDYLTGPTISEDKDCSARYTTAMSQVADHYDALIESGAAIEDARGILPTNILTNIVMKLNMRNFVEMAKKRSSPRVQGEYQSVIESMKQVALSVHPFLALFLARTQDIAAKELYSELATIEDEAKRLRMIKLVDQMK